VKQVGIQVVHWIRNDPYVNGACFMALEGAEWVASSAPTSVLAAGAVAATAAALWSGKRKRSEEECSALVMNPVTPKRFKPRILLTDDLVKDVKETNLKMITVAGSEWSEGTSGDIDYECNDSHSGENSSSDSSSSTSESNEPEAESDQVCSTSSRSADPIAADMTPKSSASSESSGSKSSGVESSDEVADEETNAEPVAAHMTPTSSACSESSVSKSSDGESSDEEADEEADEETNAEPVTAYTTAKSSVSKLSYSKSSDGESSDEEADEATKTKFEASTATPSTEIVDLCDVESDSESDVQPPPRQHLTFSSSSDDSDDEKDDRDSSSSESSDSEDEVDSKSNLAASSDESSFDETGSTPQHSPLVPKSFSRKDTTDVDNALLLERDCDKILRKNNQLA